MVTAIVNGITRQVPVIKPRSDVQFSFKSWHQLPWLMVWKVWYDEKAEVEFAKVLFQIG